MQAGLMRVLQWFYQWGSVPFFYRVADGLWLWFLGISLVPLLGSWVWGLAFVPEDYLQQNSFRIIYVHVPAAFLAQSVYLLAAISGLIYLVWRIKLYSYLLRACIPIGTLFTILALITGSIWGKPTWGTYWVWGDARLLAVVVLLFFYLSMWGLDQTFSNRNQANRAIALLAIIGVINIPIIQYSVEWWFTLHQPASLKLGRGSSIAPVMLWPLLLSIAGHYLFAAGLLLLKTCHLVLLQEQKATWLGLYVKNRVKSNIKSRKKSA